MRFGKKKIRDQVVVITGASSGIGLAAARIAAHRGARLVLCARHEQALRTICDELRNQGANAIYVAADVSDRASVQHLANTAIERFGRIDTWVNNAAVSMFGELMEVPLDDERRLFDVNYWGLVNGSLTALPYLKQTRGTLINVGSVVSNRALPIQGTYSATKHAVKAFTEALRMELEKEGAGVWVTLIKPSSIATPFTDHARNHMDARASLPPPYYAPEVVGRAIVACAQHKHRELVVGGAGNVLIWMERLFPKTTDWILEKFAFRFQRAEGPPHLEDDAVDAPPPRDGELRGAYRGYVLQSSLYTAAVLHPFATGVIILAGASTLVCLCRQRKRWLR
jgi:short-subunit dehydrogenase